ncbi:MAG: DUF1646 family protein [Clostridia bacterium]|nr:DUF1646 family protein [Clostridia bacterium]
MIIGLSVILVLVLVLPFVVKQVEHNLEPFLFLMGIAATIVSGVLSTHLAAEILQNHLMYMITGAVLIAGLLFKAFQKRIKSIITSVLKVIPLRVFVFLLVVILGLFSSIITAIIASLVLVEIINNLPLDRRSKISLDVIACFAIGLGAALTPVGEPLSTIVVSKLHGDFWLLMREVGEFIIPGVIVFGVVGAYLVGGHGTGAVSLTEEQEEETYSGVIIRAIKVFVFVMALELLGAGFKPLIDAYVIHLDSRILYWINMISAILDNATLAAAEISPAMTSMQVEAILVGLLISGGMLIPGNIPNIISAGKLKITSRDWARLGVPIGLITLILYYCVIFLLVHRA